MESINLQDKIFLHDPLGNKFSVQAVQIPLTQQRDDIQNGDLTECRLKFGVNWDSYQQIESQGLFNFDGELRGAMSDGDFLPDIEVEITTLLRPDLLDELVIPIASAATVAVYLEQLSQEQPTHELLSTESWMLLSAQQQQPQGEVKYRTLWDYLDWSLISLDDSEQKADDLLLGAIANFSKDAVSRQLATDPNYSNADPQVAEATTQLIETLFTVAPSLFSQDEAAKEQCVNAIADVFTQSLRSQLTEYLEKAFVEETVELSTQQLSEPAIAFGSSSERTIFETVAHFFQTQNWTVNPIPDQPILHFYFEGENGRWECYAQAREAQGQFIFYSVLPQKAPQVKHQAVAEYITRANYGMIIGNFEFDFSDGEIRYKTSIDVDSSTLDVAVIGQLVHTNLLNVDKYLPGILEILDGEILPKEAIASIESSR